jgi:hypothetical protein
MIFEFLGGCLSDLCARSYFRLACEYVSNITKDYKLISIEENGYEIKNRFLSDDVAEETSFGSINVSLNSTLNHLIISFRPMLNVNLILESKDSTKKKLQLQTLVLPCVPSTTNLIDFNQLKILDIGYVNVKDRIELTRLDVILTGYRHHYLRNLSLSLSEWQSARFTVNWKKENNKQITTSTAKVTSVFENCFDELVTSEEQTVSNQSPDLEKVQSVS